MYHVLTSFHAAIAQKRNISKFSKPEVYRRFHNWLLDVSRCHVESLCNKLADLICAKLQELDEQVAYEWFSGTWCGDNARWMNAYVQPGCVVHNNSLEAMVG